MSECKLDHSQEDVINKLENQNDYLPAPLKSGLTQFLKSEQPQQTLNELFHLLKKYDLASQEEQLERNRKLQQIIN
ncbi:group-specific protein [Gordoniibacillus kamchatkensis]|uniref:Group-specific protein n=1 Tax=Gordoniibacillus kamchatkensis TaxID=1590651 RepID=A0ABR5A4V7_9BACL|nr:hypothetical protein [Paenibacillus sp. VKM B-2647]KIL36077.1 group-specific protein [Paenibacillus sp. VKM B-2647]